MNRLTSALMCRFILSIRQAGDETATDTVTYCGRFTTYLELSDDIETLEVSSFVSRGDITVEGMV